MMHFLRGLFALYSWRFPFVLIQKYRQSQGKPLQFIAMFWTASDFVFERGLRYSARQLMLGYMARLLSLLVVIAGAVMIIEATHGRMTGGVAFGLTLIIGMPVIVAHVLFILFAASKLAKPKKLGRQVVCGVLEWQVRRLRRKYAFKVVAVAGSIGKTSTKMAIASLLQASRRVRWQEGNYNDRVTVPLIFFGHDEPNILNILAWARVFVANERTIRRPYPFDVVVVELGTDGPGYMEEFAYVQPDVTVLTAITPEHMEFFGTLGAVAAEETEVFAYSRKVLLNADDTDPAYVVGRKYTSYGLKSGRDYTVTKREPRGMDGQRLTFKGRKQKLVCDVALLGDQGAKIALAAFAIADILKLKPEEISVGFADVKAFAGRMNIFKGIKSSVIIDDTYNASPPAVRAALDVLYGGDVPQRIAILGSMNELGDYSPAAHAEVGAHCDPEKLDVVVTVGKDANTYLAEAARARGCTVKPFDDARKAGEYVKRRLKPGAVVLVKGSQNRVFTEEAIKFLLADKADESRLVRQSADWLAKKREYLDSL